MGKEAFKQWEQLFTHEVEEIWSKEQAVEFKTATMVLFVLKREFKNLLFNLDKEFDEIKLKYDNVNEENKATGNISALDDESIDFKSPPALKLIENVSIEEEDNTSIINGSSDDTVCPSPKITRQKYYKRKKLKLSKNDDSLKLSKKLDFDNQNTSSPKDKQDFSPKLLSQCPDDVIDCTVINGTPKNITHNSKRGKMNFLDCSKKKSGKKINKKSFQNNTLTQMLFNGENSSKENQTVDNSRFSEKSSILLENPFSTGECEVVKNDFKRPKEIVCKEPVVRGKERMKLQGWDCEECQKFYNALGLNSQDAKQLLNKCSKHRATRKPGDYTIPGYWSLSFTQTQEKNKPELEQNKTEESTFFQF